MFPSFPTGAAVCRWAARGAVPSCHLSGRSQFPSHQFPSRNEGVDGNDERRGDFNTTVDSTVVPVATGRIPTLELVVNITAVRSQPSNSRHSPVTHFSVMWGSADTVSRPVVCRWREHTVPLGGVVRLKLELSSLKDPLPCNR